MSKRKASDLSSGHDNPPPSNPSQKPRSPTHATDQDIIVCLDSPTNLDDSLLATQTISADITATPDQPPVSPEVKDNALPAADEPPPAIQNTVPAQPMYPPPQPYPMQITYSITEQIAAFVMSQPLGNSLTQQKKVDETCAHIINHSELHLLYNFNPNNACIKNYLSGIIRQIANSSSTPSLPWDIQMCIEILHHTLDLFALITPVAALDSSAILDVAYYCLIILQVRSQSPYLQFPSLVLLIQSHFILKTIYLNLATFHPRLVDPCSFFRLIEILLIHLHNEHLRLIDALETFLDDLTSYQQSYVDDLLETQQAFYLSLSLNERNALTTAAIDASSYMDDEQYLIALSHGHVPIKQTRINLHSSRKCHQYYRMRSLNYQNHLKLAYEDVQSAAASAKESTSTSLSRASLQSRQTTRDNNAGNTPTAKDSTEKLTTLGDKDRQRDPQQTNSQQQISSSSNPPTHHESSTQNSSQHSSQPSTMKGGTALPEVPQPILPKVEHQYTSDGAAYTLSVPVTTRGGATTSAPIPIPVTPPATATANRQMYRNHYQLVMPRQRPASSSSDQKTKSDESDDSEDSADDELRRVTLIHLLVRKRLQGYHKQALQQLIILTRCQHYFMEHAKAYKNSCHIIYSTSLERIQTQQQLLMTQCYQILLLQTYISSLLGNPQGIQPVPIAASPASPMASVPPTSTSPTSSTLSPLPSPPLPSMDDVESQQSHEDKDLPSTLIADSHNDDDGDDMGHGDTDITTTTNQDPSPSIDAADSMSSIQDQDTDSGSLPSLINSTNLHDTPTLDESTSTSTSTPNQHEHQSQHTRPPPAQLAAAPPPQTVRLLQSLPPHYLFSVLMLLTDRFDCMMALYSFLVHLESTIYRNQLTSHHLGAASTHPNTARHRLQTMMGFPPPSTPESKDQHLVSHLTTLLLPTALPAMKKNQQVQPREIQQWLNTRGFAVYPPPHNKKPPPRRNGHAR